MCKISFPTPKKKVKKQEKYEKSFKNYLFEQLRNTSPVLPFREILISGTMPHTFRK